MRGILLNLTRAFDIVSVLGILDKLGVKNEEYSWICSYLQNRKQFIEVDHSYNNVCRNHSYVRKYHSQKQIFKCGVPQGSILGSLLCLCYLKGLPGRISDIWLCLSICI